jgi:hypothetical protein
MSGGRYTYGDEECVEVLVGKTEGKLLGRPGRRWKYVSCINRNLEKRWVLLGPKMDEVTGEWRKLHNEELSDLFSLPNIVRVVKSRRMRWAGHVDLLIEIWKSVGYC